MIQIELTPELAVLVRIAVDWLKEEPWIDAAKPKLDELRAMIDSKLTEVNPEWSSLQGRTLFLTSKLSDDQVQAMLQQTDKPP